MTFCPYLSFNGTCAEAFERYSEIFGAEITFMEMYSDAPESESMPEWSSDRVMHARLQLGDHMLMASDMPSSSEVKCSGISVQMGFETVEEARRVYDALAEGGSIMMPFEKTFWSAGFGGVVDRFGIPWLINCDQPAD